MSSIISESISTDYCHNKVATEGSTLYYAILFEQAQTKQQIVSLHAFLSELSDVIVECSDPGVAHIKFKWWQEEIERLFDKKPRHPVTKELANNFKLVPNTKYLFDQTIIAFESMLHMQQPETLEQVLSLFHKTTYLIREFIGQFNNSIHNKSLDLISEMSAINHFLHCLQQANVFLNEQRFIIPATFCSYNELNPSSNKIKSMLFELKRSLENSYNDFPNNDRGEVKHVLILNRLTVSLCNEILEDDCQISEKRISLTPIRKLWIAWSTHISIKYFNWL